MRLAAHVGRDPQEHPLNVRAAAGRARAVRLQEPPQSIDLIKIIDDDQTDAVRQRRAQLILRLGVPVHHDALRREARVQRQVQLPARGDVAPQPLLREQREHSSAGEGLRGEHDVEVLVARLRARVDERTRTGSQVILGHHVGRRAELPRQLDRVAAADLQPAGLVQPAAQREHIGEHRLGRHRRGLSRACSGRRGPQRGPAPPRRAIRRQPEQADRHQPEALQLRRREPREDLAVAADELDQEALEAAQQQVQGKHDPGPDAIAQLPQTPCDRHIATVS